MFKQLCWKHIKDNERFLELFSSLGTEVHLDNDQLRGFEKFGCTIFGEKRLNLVNDARRKTFWQKWRKSIKKANLPVLPPCQSSLTKHSRRSNYIAYTSQNAYRPMMKIMAGFQIGVLTGLKNHTLRM